MPGRNDGKRCAATIFAVALTTLACVTAYAGNIPTSSDQTSTPTTASFELGTTGMEPLIDSTDLVMNSQLTQALVQGQWKTVCPMATDMLAKKQTDIDALGAFAICAAVRNDRKVADKALMRLRQAEAPPYYYAQLTEGILKLKGQSATDADSMFKNIVAQRSGDALAFYFSGEALHAQGKDAEALAAFNSCLRIWPDHAPALAAVARLSANKNASKDALKLAINQSERAAGIDPMNRTYWELLAELCDRSGEHGRASAIRLQWLSERTPRGE